MERLLAVALALSALVLSPPAVVAQAATEAEEVREYQLQHLTAQEANVLVRSTLNPRRLAIDERRNVYIVTDTREQHDKIAALLARIDVAAPTWTVALIARSGSATTTLRTAMLTQGHLEVRYGSPATEADDDFEVTAEITRATSGEVDLEWSMSLALAGRAPQSARARETLREGATVTLLDVSQPHRRERLRRLLGVEGIESLVLEVRRAEPSSSSR